MSAAAIAIIVVVAVVVLVFFAMAMTRRRLQQRFGPEYDRVVGEKRGQFRGAAELARRERRVQRLRIRPLSASVRAEYVAEWRAVQEGFVDHPLHAVIDGQGLLASVMRERGYPAEDADQIAADLSVTHAATLGDYRAAQEISANAERGDASTEDLRQALLHLRIVFGELLGKPSDAEPAESVEAGPRVPGRGPQVPRSRVPAGGNPAAANRGAADPDAADRAPDAAAREAALRETEARDAPVRDDPSRDGAVRDGAIVGGPVRADAAPDAVEPDAAARDGAVVDGPVRAGAGTQEPEEQLWRPGVRVPPAQTSTEETMR
jgi:hypothetical protein